MARTKPSDIIGAQVGGDAPMIEADTSIAARSRRPDRQLQPVKKGREMQSKVIKLLKSSKGYIQVATAEFDLTREVISVKFPDGQFLEVLEGGKTYIPQVTREMLDEMIRQHLVVADAADPTIYRLTEDTSKTA